MWHKIINITDWFVDFTERHRLIRDFNKAAKMSFISGVAPSLLESKITRGDSRYKHAFSKFMAGGFRIKALSDRSMTESELIEVGRVILDNESLVRKLISLGWDTLEVHDNKGFHGVKWSLKEYANIGGHLY